MNYLFDGFVRDDEDNEIMGDEGAAAIDGDEGDEDDEEEGELE